LLDNAIAAGTWDRHDQSPSNVSWSTNTFDYPGSITSATWNGNTVAANRGGTGQSSPFVAGGVAYGSTTSALGVTPIGTAGQVLTSAGAGTPTWTTPTTGTVTSVTGTSPIASSGGATPAISIANAAADGTTKGAAAFNASDFDATAGVISIDYTNGQAASGSTKGFLTSTDWTTFNSKQATITTGSVDNAILRADGTGGATLQNSDLNIDDATVSTQANVAITNQHSGQANSALVLTPKGNGALVAGPKPDGTVTGGNARGIYAVDLQIARGLSTKIASGPYAFTVGIDNLAANFHSIALGYNNLATGVASTALGAFNSASGNGSFAAGTFSSSSGGNVASASGTSCPGGFRAQADRYGQFAYANGSFSAAGDAQRERFVLRCKTTTNTGVEMALDGATTYLGIPSGKVISMTINISGIKSDGTAVAHYVRQYAVKNVSGTSTQVYAPVTIGSDNAAGTIIALSVSDADDTLRILVTGIASETWRWVASVDAVEIAYGT